MTKKNGLLMFGFPALVLALSLIGRDGAGLSAGKSLGGDAAIDRATLDEWSAPYRGWHYWPDHVIPAEPKIPGHEAFQNTDVPCVYQLPGQPDKWFMSFIAFDGQGYNSFVAESTDSVLLDESPAGDGLRPAGRIRPRRLRHRRVPLRVLRHQGAAPAQAARRQVLDALRLLPAPGRLRDCGPATKAWPASDDGLTWRRAKDTPILSVQDPDCGAWEKDCIYQPWLVEHRGPVLRLLQRGQRRHRADRRGPLHRPAELEAVSRATPSIRDPPGRLRRAVLLPTPRCFATATTGRCSTSASAAGAPTSWPPSRATCCIGRRIRSRSTRPAAIPADWTRQYAHKISLVYNPPDETFYLYYCACGNKGRGIGLITSKPIAR